MEAEAHADSIDAETQDGTKIAEAETKEDTERKAFVAVCMDICSLTPYSPHQRFWTWVLLSTSILYILLCETITFLLLDRHFCRTSD